MVVLAVRGADAGGALGGRNPEVGTSGVEVDLEGLGWGPNGDWSVVENGEVGLEGQSVARLVPSFVVRVEGLPLEDLLEGERVLLELDDVDAEGRGCEQCEDDELVHDNFFDNFC